MARTLSGRKVVCVALDVGLRVALRWIEAGAPVVIEGEGPGARWVADADELEAWRRRHLAPPRRTARHRAPPARRSRR